VPILLLRLIPLLLRGVVVVDSVAAAVFLGVVSFSAVDAHVTVVAVSEVSIGVVSELPGGYFDLSLRLVVDVWQCTCCQTIHCRCPKFE